MKNQKKILKLKREYSSFFAEQEKKRAQYLAFIDSIKELEPLPRVEAWLTYIAENIEDFVEQEALVYSISRGKKCKKQIERLIEFWKESREFAYRHVLPVGKKPQFWYGRDEQEQYLDSTMLRTVEWCKIGGFDEFWEDKSKETFNEIVRNGISDKKSVCFWLFWMCRSDYAIELMPKPLEKFLEAIQLVDFGKEFPWEDALVEAKKGKNVSCDIDYLALAATLIFVTARLKPSAIDNILVNNAGKLLLKSQLRDGSWPFYLKLNGSNPKEGSVESTAMIVHSLMYLKPRGWEHAVQKAKAWLLSKQSVYGYWDDEGEHPNFIFLTVLVMDAIALINGQTNITFKFSRASEKQVVGKKQTKRKKFSERERTTVWNKEFGLIVDRDKCPICNNNEISRTNFAMGHRKSLANGGTNDLKNIRPICHNCNSMMAEMDMKEYIRQFLPKEERDKT